MDATFNPGTVQLKTYEQQQFHLEFTGYSLRSRANEQKQQQQQQPDACLLTTFEIAQQQNLVHYLTLLLQERFENKLKDTDVDDLFSLYRDTFNQRQFAGLYNAFHYTISAIKGPPDTGNTRTIADIQDICSGKARRLLIIAPANAASRRILESIVGTSFQDVCLLVGQE